MSDGKIRYRISGVKFFSDIRYPLDIRDNYPMIRDISPDILPDKYLEKSFQKKKKI